jgi:hypothetical protein
MSFWVITIWLNKLEQQVNAIKNANNFCFIIVLDVNAKGSYFSAIAFGHFVKMTTAQSNGLGITFVSVKNVCEVYY